MLDNKGLLHFSATDLAGHLSCNHLTQLDAEVARGARAKPKSWGNCSPGSSSGYSVPWLRQWTAFPCRAMVMAIRGLYPSAAMVWR